MPTESSSVVVFAGRGSKVGVQVVEHDLIWNDAYRIEAARIAAVLGDLVVSVHHIGSTAIPNIVAKPIIDVLLEVRDILHLDREISTLEGLGYEAKGEFGIPGRRYFRKNDAQGRRTHHVHAFPRGSAHVERHLAFRDYRGCAS
jgi:GrpB-like predicted nucleotidyltransferase (UPF0157 family)